MEQFMTAEEAAQRLGVTVRTVYAYVSRGLLNSHRGLADRISLYDRREVERLRLRSAFRNGAVPMERREVVIETSITLLEPEGHLYYRGWDVTEAARTASFERVAEWLWMGRGPGPERPGGAAVVSGKPGPERPGGAAAVSGKPGPERPGGAAAVSGEPEPWEAEPAAVEVVRAAFAALPDGISLVDRIRIAAAVAGTVDPLRHDLRPEAVVMVGRTLISTLVDTLPDLDRGAAPTDPAGGHAQGDPHRSGVEPGTGAVAARPGTGAEPVATRAGTGAESVAARPGTGAESIAARLWPKLSDRVAAPAELTVLNAALVLLADHEMAASTFGARVAACTHADPYLVVQAGLGVLGGPLHGAVTESVRDFLAEVADSGRPAAQVVGDRLGGPPDYRMPGVGHSVYKGPDPRAPVLLRALASASPDPKAWAAVQEVLALIKERNLPYPNVDMAMGAVCVCLGLAEGAGEAVFAVARCAGWLAHAIEEYPYRLRFRPRAVYTGINPPPVPDTQDPDYDEQLDRPEPSLAELDPDVPDEDETAT